MLAPPTPPCHPSSHPHPLPPHPPIPTPPIPPSPQKDLVDAIKEVDEGYITDDVVREKRKLAAIMLRRMEVEEWDKERMRHFYYGLYGLGPWCGPARWGPEREGGKAATRP
jgi:hypothetical protein